jgi:putative peptide zinc metalloprotease protein
VQELQQFVAQLIGQGLVVAAVPGYGRLLVTRDHQAQSRKTTAKLTNLLCLRFRGIDPDQLLSWLLVRLNWLFSPALLGASLLLIAAAVTLVVVQFDQMVERLPDAQALLSPPNLFWMSVLLAAVKIAHEFGHGLACKKFGGECRELGVMFLVFTPTLYCNVSDMWMVHDKWKRIAVSAAGMWVEAVIAAGCTLLWWYSAPGLFQTLCLNLMFICGVSTFLFNGNPLLRYDGYFVLADWLEIPNLQQQSMSAVRAWLGWCFCGIPDRDRSVVSRKGLLIAYGIASGCYRIMLSFLILWTLYRWLEPHGLAVIVHVLAVPMIGMMIMAPLMAVVRFVKSPDNRSQVDWGRFRFRTTLAALVLAAVVVIPVPTRVRAGALVDQDTAQRVYVTFSGTLESGVKIGDFVEAGQVIARLSDSNMETELIRLEGELQQRTLRLDHLDKRRIQEPGVAAMIPAAREAIHDLEIQLKQLRESADRLVLRAPCAGTVLPAPLQIQSTPHGSLPSWQGSPLDERNYGCLVKSGTTICLVGPPTSQAAMLLVNQDDINLVRVGQIVRTVWRELSGEIITGRIVEIAAIDLDQLPRDAVVRLHLPSRATADGTLVPIGTWYLVRVHLDSNDVPLLRGAAGDAKIIVDSQSLLTRLIRWLARTFG